jgi:hypothetical protein
MIKYTVETKYCYPSLVFFFFNFPFFFPFHLSSSDHHTAAFYASVDCFSFCSAASQHLSVCSVQSTQCEALLWPMDWKPHHVHPRILKLLPFMLKYSLRSTNDCHSRGRILSCRSSNWTHKNPQTPRLFLSTQPSTALFLFSIRPTTLSTTAAWMRVGEPWPPYVSAQPLLLPAQRRRSGVAWLDGERRSSGVPQQDMNPPCTARA